MLVEISGRNEHGLRTVRFEPPVYVTAGGASTCLVLGVEEYAALARAVDEDQAAESGDFETEPKTDERETEAWLNQ